MSGYLQHLVQRARIESTVIRPRQRTIYEPSRFAEEGGAKEIIVSRKPDDTAPRSVRVPAKPLESVERRMEPVDERDPGATRARAAFSGEQVPSAKRSPASEMSSPEAPFPSPELAVPPPAREVARSAPSREETPGHAAHSETPRVAAEPPREESPPATVELTRSRPMDIRPAAAETPSPPRETPIRTSRAERPAETYQENNDGAPREPSVEVRIGRVEVRANLTPPPPPARKPARSGPRLSLEAYMEQRREGSGR